MINGYTDQSSVFPEDTLTFRVSTDAPQFRIEVYRQGAALQLLMTSAWFPGVNAPAHDADEDWGVDSHRNNQLRIAWPAHDVTVPAAWRTGVYIAMFVEGDGAGNERGNTPPLDRSTADARSGKALFVLKSPAPGACARILYKIPLLTYHAYDKDGGWSLYQFAGAVVCLHRTGGGTGGNPWDFLAGYFNPGNPTVPLQAFAQWDAPFIAWIESEGYCVDYITDVDLDQVADVLDPYALILSVGHDEYWSDAMRDRAEGYIAAGGNFAFFSGNTCWWRVQWQDPLRFSRTANWYDPMGPNRPENSLTGVSYRNAGEGDLNRPSIGFVVQNDSHWIFNGTGVANNDTFGTPELLVGYECDGANFDRNLGPPFNPSLDDGTPASFTILGVADVSSFNDADGNKAATMGIYTQGGTVFTAATTDWPRVVGLNLEPVTAQITRNVFAGLSNVNPIDVSAITGSTITGTPTSWQTPDGPYLIEHIAGVDTNGSVLVFYWSPQADWQVVDVSAITGASLAPGAPLTSWQTPDGPYNVEHVAGVDSDGHVVIFYWSPQANWQAVDASAISGRSLAMASPVTSWQTPNGPYNVEHVAGVDAQGFVVVFYWSSQANWQAVEISVISGRQLAGRAALTSWLTPDGAALVEHVAGADDLGNLVVFYWSSNANWQAIDVTAIAGRSAASGAPAASWQTPNGALNLEHVAAIDLQGNLLVFYWSPQTNWQVVDVSAITGISLAPGSSVGSWQTPIAAPAGKLLAENLVAIASDGSAYKFTWTPVTDWCAQNLSKLCGVGLNRGITTWQVPDGPYSSQHIGGTSTGGNLFVIEWE